MDRHHDRHDRQRHRLVRLNVRLDGQRDYQHYQPQAGEGVMAHLTKEQILGVSDANVVSVDVPEWGGSVWLRKFSGAARDKWDLFIAANTGPDAKFKQEARNIRATLVALTLCDEMGQSLGFTPSEVEQLSGKDGGVLGRLYEKANELNKLTKESQEDLVKNSPSGQS
jgi:hypothetical protein